MVTRGKGTQWHRPEFKDREGELESRDEFEKRRGLDGGVMNSRFYDYADRAPGVVKEEGRRKFFVATELEKFYEGIEGYSKPRTTAEVLASKVARAEGTVEEHEARVRNAQEDLDRKKRSLDFHQKKLIGLRQQLEIERASAE